MLSDQSVTRPIWCHISVTLRLDMQACCLLFVHVRAATIEKVNVVRVKPHWCQLIFATGLTMKSQDM